MGGKRHIPAAVNRVSVGCGHVGGRSTTRFGEFRLEGVPQGPQCELQAGTRRQAIRESVHFPCGHCRSKWGDDLDGACHRERAFRVFCHLMAVISPAGGETQHLSYDMNHEMTG